MRELRDTYLFIDLNQAFDSEWRDKMISQCIEKS